MKNVVQDLTSAGLDWDREKWRGSVASKFIRGGEKNAVKYADEIIVLSKDVQKYFLETYGRGTHFIPNGVNRPEVREAKLITDHFGLEKDSYILFLGRLVPEKGIRYLVEAFKNVKTDKKLVIAGGSSDTDSFMEEYSSFRCCWKQMVWQQEKTISLKDGMMPRKMQLSFRLKKMNKVPSRLKSVQLDITSTWTYNTSKWT